MNPYKILGVSESDSEDEVRQRYKKLALQYHPDKNKDPSAVEKFKEISEAYQLIRGGIADDSPELNELHEIFNLFQGLFGGNMYKQPKGPVTRADLLLSLEEIYCGGKFNVQYRKKHFTGRMGQTSEMRQMGPIAIQEIKIKPEFIWEDASIELDLLPGSITNQPIIIEMEDHTVSVEIREKKHPTFIRFDNDLGVTLDITLWESLLGFSRTIIHLDSRELELNCKSIITPDTVKEIDDEGMPLPNGEFGKLFVKFKIKFPEELTDQQRKSLEQIDQTI